MTILGSGRRRAILAMIAIAALVFGPLATFQLTLTAPRSPALLLTDLAVGWAMIAAGLLIADRRPGHGLATLAVVAGFAWFVGDLASSDVAIVAYVGRVLHGWFDSLFAMVVLAYPSGRLVGGAARSLAAGFIVVQGAWTAGKAVADLPTAMWSCQTCIGSVDAWVTWQQVMDPAGRLETLALTALSLGVLGLVGMRWARASAPARRRWTPGLLAGVVLALGFIVSFWLETIAPESARTATGEVRVVGLAVLRILVAVALLVGVLRDDAARGRIADLVVRLEGLPSTAVLQSSLREALGDTSLVVMRWSPERDAYLDSGERPTDPPPDGPARASLRIEHGGRPALIIAHDPSLRDDPALICAAVAAVRLAVDNERLQAEVRAQLDAIQASRARLVEAQDSERRRIERDLHDGAQQRLVSLQLSLQMLRTGLGPDIEPEVRAELDAAAEEARAAIAEIRELARGVHPAILTEGGLAPALSSLAERSPLPVELASSIDRRLPGPVEATAYFVVAEALTNATRHAEASRVTIAAGIQDDRLRIEIVDDGRGGATADGGSGLRGLEDRVAALGGTLSIDSPADAGTRLTIELPCASS